MHALRWLAVAISLTVQTGSALAQADVAEPKEAAKPLRVLMFADGPTREYQLCRRLFLTQVDKKQVELTICLQAGDPTGPRSQDLPVERLPKDFPASLAGFDLILAFDPDWTRLSVAQLALLEPWVKQGGGLVVVAGPVNTGKLAQPDYQKPLKPIIDLYPVEVAEAKPTAQGIRMPWKLTFAAGAADMKFLSFDDGPQALAHWDAFFSTTSRRATDEDRKKIAGLIAALDSPRFETREQATKELEKIGFSAQAALEKALAGKPPLEVRTRIERLLALLELPDFGRGFYSFHPVKKVKPTAAVVATFNDPDARMPDGKEHPYLVKMAHGTGKVVYLGSGETWRLRLFKEAYHELFWVQLGRYAASK
jgi:hypothetical protein